MLKRRKRRGSRIILLLVGNAICGAGFGVAVAVILLAADFAGLHRLLASSAEPLPALALLAGGFAAGFAALVASTAVMLIPPHAASPAQPRR